MLMATDRYQLSFTAGGLFMREAPMIAARFLRCHDWRQTRAEIRQENLLQQRTATAATRLSKELVARLETLSVVELEELIDSPTRDKGYILWVAACRRYRFVRDFATEVMREHYLSLRHKLNTGDYESFYNGKALWHAELDGLADSTQQKLRQNLFRMLREADLLSPKNQIQAVLMSPRIAQLIARRGLEDLLVFPASEKEIQRWLS
jgi:hypothetical protein